MYYRITNKKKSNNTIVVTEKISVTYFLEKSLKQSLSLFWSLEGVPLPSAMSDRNTTAISMGPWFTVVPVQTTVSI